MIEYDYIIAILNEKSMFQSTFPPTVDEKTLKMVHFNQ